MSDAITPKELDAMHRQADFVLVDIRRQSDLELDGTCIPGAIRGDPESLDSWASSLPADRTIVVYCARGGSVSKTVAPELVARGLKAKYVTGGIAAWKDFGGEVVPVKRHQ